MKNQPEAPATVEQALFDKWDGKDNAKALKEAYIQKLKTGAWVVEFTKVDGTPSTMTVTLDPRLLPIKREPVDITYRLEKDHLVHAYSLDRAGWRSFVVKNVTKFYPKPESI